uniref:Uncharacterized protein n=1 Tax=Edwardsiella tarda TaxID=636 RepID=E5L735_EDWTA|nr:hypothetical protein ETCK41_p33 [Edwardsiella tarda]
MLRGELDEFGRVGLKMILFLADFRQNEQHRLQITCRKLLIFQQPGKVINRNGLINHVVSPLRLPFYQPFIRPNFEMILPTMALSADGQALSFFCRAAAV